MLSALYYLFLIALCTLFMLLSAVALVICWPFDKGRRVVHELSRILVRTFFFVPLRWRQKVVGLEYVDRKKTVCHRAEPQYGNRYSGALLRAAQFPVGFEAGGIQDALFGQYLVLHGDICIDRGRAAEAMEQLLCKGKRWISRGASIAIFPEGTRSKDGEIHRFKAGAFTLAKEAGVEILPVVLDGTKSLIRRNLLFNWGNRITLRILPPVPVERVVSADLHELMEEVHDAMCGALAEIRQAKH